MESQEGRVTRKNRLAVFEHVVEKSKSSKKRKLIRFSEDSSQSESELVVDDERERDKSKKRKPFVKLPEEPLSMHCQWNSCTDIYDSWEKFDTHVLEHATCSSGELLCQWSNCSFNHTDNMPIFMQHLSFHAYLSKLYNIGENIAKRDMLPNCTETQISEPYKHPGFNCEWEYCDFSFCTMFKFLNHMNVHIWNNPKRSVGKEVILCCWNDCNSKYSSQVKLADHLKTHTKEKVVGCGNCRKLFANKTKFYDHRKRQLSSALQNYQCSQCLKLFPSERLLRDHMRSHVNHYKCTMCDMTCPKPSILAKHIRFKHVNFKPYKCQQCDKTFVEKHNLVTHVKTHVKENPLKCHLCDFECRSKYGLDNHLIKKHDSVRFLYECHCCKKKFKRGSYLTQHLTKLHNYHWPSGHSRFRYRKDEDGIFRLQTVRYESLEVTQEMIRSETMQSNNLKESATYNLKYDNDGKSGYVLSISENGEHQCVQKQSEKENSNVLVTINDVDERGNILKCQVLEATVVPVNQVSPIHNVVSVQDASVKEDKDDSDAQPTKTSKEEIKIEEHAVRDILKDDFSNTNILDYKIFKNLAT